MAMIAAGKTCEAHCGTLVTCVGDETDEVLTGTCPYDGRVNTYQRTVATMFATPLDELKKQTVSKADHDTAQARILELETEVADLKAAGDGGHLSEPVSAPSLNPNPDPFVDHNVRETTSETLMQPSGAHADNASPNLTLDAPHEGAIESTGFHGS